MANLEFMSELFLWKNVTANNVDIVENHKPGIFCIKVVVLQTNNREEPKINQRIL